MSDKQNLRTVATTADDFKYRVDDAGVVIEGLKRREETSVVKEMAIPATIEGRPVVGVDVNAFTWRVSLTTVAFPPGLRTIGSGAFGGCGSLTTVSLPPELRTIGKDAFKGCERCKYDGAEGDGEPFESL